MSDQEQLAITITLSPAQIDSVVRAASRGSAPSISALIAETLTSAPQRANGQSPAGAATADEDAAGESARSYLPTDTDDPRLSRSLLRGLSLLRGFDADGGERGIVELAEAVGMSPSTAHRYALTLVELGLLERCPRTRKYRLATV
jgi:IclR helix-turn-helix domain